MSSCLGGAVGQHVGDHVAGLGQVRGADDVRDRAAGAGGGERGPQQAPLQRGQLGDVLRAAPPAGLRAAAQRAEAGARGVHQHPVEGAGAPGRDGAVGADHGDREAGGGRGDQAGPVRGDLHRDQPRPAPGRG